ncbi:hypothetical protein TPA0598_04_01100 [Streptomyces lydicamycinicus]|uniref:Uncharacterized protein n=1 Tax=Streptomyces lydicamycinicus TaxID=1546107 RepID=A0A0P4R6G4_9ACTN|nr:hypothetical protein TPA0598_04_01100 [Streptomyces lydicamycinicus]
MDVDGAVDGIVEEDGFAEAEFGGERGPGVGTGERGPVADHAQLIAAAPVRSAEDPEHLKINHPDSEQQSPEGATGARRRWPNSGGHGPSRTRPLTLTGAWRFRDRARANP